MKKLFAIITLLLFPVWLQATTLTGSIKYPDGTGVTGRIFFHIITQGAVSSSGSCGGPYVVVPTTDVIFNITAGSLPGGAAVVGNDCVEPANTWYIVTVRDQQNNVLFQQTWSITGSSIDVGTIIPTPPGPGFSGAVLLTPVGAATQSITGTIQAGTTATYDVGSSTNKWRDFWASRTVHSGVDYRIGTAGTDTGGLELASISSTVINLGDPFAGTGRWTGIDFYPGTTASQFRIDNGGARWPTVDTTPTCAVNFGRVWFDGTNFKVCVGATGPSTLVVSGGGTAAGWTYSSPIISMITSGDQVILGQATDPGSVGYRLLVNNGLAVLSSSTANTSVGALAYDAGSSSIRIASGKTGSGTVLPLSVTVSNADGSSSNIEMMRFVPQTVSATPTTVVRVNTNSAGDTILWVFNETNGASSRSILRVGNQATAPDGKDISLLATKASYSGVSGWTNAGVITAGSAIDNLIINTQQSGVGVLFQLGATTTDITFTSGGKAYFGGTTSPTAYMHLPPGTTNATTAPLKLTTAGAALMTTPEAGALETDGTSLYWTDNSGTRAAIGSGGGGGVTTSGSPATNRVSKFTAATVIGNSLISDDGTSVYVNATSTQDPATTLVEMYRSNNGGTVNLTRNDSTGTSAYSGTVARSGNGSSSNDITLGVTGVNFSGNYGAAAGFVTTGTAATGGLILRTTTGAVQFQPAATTAVFKMTTDGGFIIYPSTAAGVASAGAWRYNSGTGKLQYNENNSGWNDISNASGVTGTGTASYVPKWSSTTAIGNSLLYDDGTSLILGGIVTNDDSQIHFEATRTATNGEIILSRNASTGSAAYSALAARSGTTSSVLDITMGVTSSGYTTASGLAASTGFVRTGTSSTGGLVLQTVAGSIVFETAGTTARATFDGSGNATFTGGVGATTYSGSGNAGFAGVVTGGSFSGVGTALTSLNGSNIASGTVAIARGGTGVGSFTTNRLDYYNGSTLASSTLSYGGSGDIHLVTGSYRIDTSGQGIGLSTDSVAFTTNTVIEFFVASTKRMQVDTTSSTTNTPLWLYINGTLTQVALGSCTVASGTHSCLYIP